MKALKILGLALLIGVALPIAVSFMAAPPEEETSVLTDQEITELIESIKAENERKEDLENHEVNKPITQTENLRVETKVEPSMYQVMRDGFMSGCLGENGEYYDYCDCMFDDLYYALGEEKFIELSTDVYLDDNYFSQSMEDAVDRCLYLL